MVDLNYYDYFLIVDLEATCCDQKTIARHEMEIIEIGAVMVEKKSLVPVDEYQAFVKPVRHPRLTSFCKSLTSIQQSDVDNALRYPEVIQQFKEWMYQYDNFLFCSWGDYDKGQFEQDCRMHAVPYPFASEHVNIKVLFSQNQNLKKKFGMADALAYAKIPLQGTHHRGIDDARNMAKLMPYILGQKMLK